VLVQPGHVDIGAARLPRAQAPRRAQARHERIHPRAVDQVHPRAQRRIVGHEGFQRRAVLSPPDHQRAAWLQETVPGQVIARGKRERHHRRAAIDLVPERGGTAGGVIAGVSSASTSSTRA
jgi:hypothetical protein